ncbi:MAG: hypothetical protein ACXVCR_14685, partial [Bdellovibrio sp.]
MDNIKLSAPGIFILVPFLIGSSAFALNLADLRGDSRTNYQSPTGTQEFCVIPKKISGGQYDPDDLKKETTLCGYDFYTNIGVCPKLLSTNPATLLIAPTAQYGKEAIDSSNCDLKQMNLSTAAKFKQSVSCSYTPAILSYYQLSRLLGNIGRVPPAVVRTMDIKTHSRLTDKAISLLPNPEHPTRISWNTFSRVHQTPQLYPSVVDQSLTQIYGALADNIKKEEQYFEVSGVGPYENRYERFLKQKPFHMVSNWQSVRQLIGSSQFTNVAQTVVQMKDVSDMILLDTLLNQQDRIGNIHYKFYWYSINPQTNTVERTKSDAKWVNGIIKVPDEETRAMNGKQAVLLKEMVLKDNDCGVIKSNMMRKFNVLEKVRHMSYNTYRRFLTFAQALREPSMQNYFKEEMLFTNEDLAGLMDNTMKAKQILLQKCQS